MAAATQSFVLDQGSVFEISLTVWEDKANGSLLDLTAAVFRMDIKTNVDATTTILSLSSPSSGITINTTTSVITVTITATQTAAIDNETMVYDLKYIPGGVEADAIRWMQGSLCLSREVTE